MPSKALTSKHSSSQGSKLGMPDCIEAISPLRVRPVEAMTAPLCMLESEQVTTESMARRMSA